MTTPTTSRRQEIGKLLRRLDQVAMRCFEGALALCASRSHFDVTPDHLLLRLLDETSGDVPKILEAYNIDRSSLRRGLQAAMQNFPAGNPGKPQLSPKLVDILQSASVLADDMGVQQIRTGLLILAIALNPGLTQMSEHTAELQRIDADALRDRFSDIVGDEPEVAGPAQAAGPAPSGAPGETGVLNQFCIDVTARAAAGEIDPIFGRDHEIRQMIDVLARRRKNNPILVGDPGTGKTAIAEGLALRIISGDVPPGLAGTKLLSLDLGLLQAGAGVKGEFENRLKAVIREIKASPVPIVTFIDEAHTMIGAGNQAGGGDAANLLKPALARGELRTVAATTWAEYKKYFEKDPALSRRFQLVKVEEPDEEAAITMIRGLKEQYENHHGVIVTDEGVKAAVHLSMRYIHGRLLPDKAVDLLDTAAARVAVGLTTRPASLDDYQRRLDNLTTAIRAKQRDEATGAALDPEGLAEMTKVKEQLTAEAEAIEARWRKELAIVRKIQELRKQLSGDGQADKKPAAEATGGGAEKKDGDQDSAQATATKPAPTAPPATASDKPSEPAIKLDPEAVAKIRGELAELTKEIKVLQGQSPLVHVHVGPEVVGQVVSDWTGIPIGNMLKDEVSAILHLEDRLRNRVVGQDLAISVIADKLRTAKSGIRNPQQPMGVFLCVGPSGVGKTECALTLSEVMFGGEQSMVVINMSEFMEKHTVSQLKGSPPGYVGYGEGGVLTEGVRQRPYCVVLLDEVEKAHQDVMNLFYQVFDKGTLADGTGRIINFSNTVIILTSNLGTDTIQGLCEENPDIGYEELRDAIYPHLRDHFKPALLARMSVVPFRTIGPEVMKLIVDMKLGKVAKRLREAHRITLGYDEAVRENIAGRCTQVDLGARNVDHILDQFIMAQISRAVLEQMGREQMPTRLQIGVGDDGKFTYTFSD